MELKIDPDLTLTLLTSRMSILLEQEKNEELNIKVLKKNDN